MPNYMKSIIQPHAKIFLVGEAPGEEEDRYGKPFWKDAPAGKTLNQLLDQAGINRAECSIGNVARERPPGNKIGFYFEDKKCTSPKPIMKFWTEELKQEIISSKPNIVVLLGATAMRALLGESGIADNRGYVQESMVIPGQKMLVTWHPQKINYEWKLGFESIMDLRKAKAQSEFPEIKPDNRSLNAYPSTIEWIQYLQYLLNDHRGPIALDVEVADTEKVHIGIVGIADNPNHALSFQFFQGPGREPRLTPEKEMEVWYWIARVLDKKVTIMQNGMYDTPVMWLKNRVLARQYTEDTMVQAHVCWPEVKRSLGFLASICLDVPRWKQTSSSAPTLYNAADAANTYGIWEVLNAEIDKLHCRETYRFEMMQVWPAMMMHLQGIPVNRERQQDLIKSVNQRLYELKDEISTMIGKDVNLNSPKQLQTLLYIDMKLPVQYKRRKSRWDDRKITADAEALQKLQRSSKNPVLIKILEWKKLNKLLDFVDIELSPEGRVHTTYNVTGATMRRVKKGLVVDDEESYKSFGRWSSSKSIVLPYGSGNLQNIPHTARLMYEAPPGYEYLQADYIQAEAVVVAHLIGDEGLKKMFRNSFGATKEERDLNFWDVHRMTASMMLGILIDQVTPDQRQVGKVIRHATNYSAGPGVVVNLLGCPMKEAKEFLSRFHNSCPQLRLWHQSIQKELYKCRSLTNLLGRTHRFLERWGDELFRSAYSFIPQSTIGDLLNTALIRLYNRYGSILLLCLQLHDAIYTLSKLGYREENMERMRECMIMPLMHKGKEFYIDVDFKAGPSWGYMEEL